LRASTTLAQPASGIPSGLMGHTVHSQQQTDSHTETEPQDMFMCDQHEEGWRFLLMVGQAIRW
jgi:hypothetical protein